MKIIIVIIAIILVAVLCCSCENWRKYVPEGDYLWICTKPDIWFDSSEDNRILLSDYSGTDGGSSIGIYGMPGEITAADGTKQKIAVVFSSVRPFVTFYICEDDRWIIKYALDCEYEETGFTITVQAAQDSSMIHAFFGEEFDTLYFQRSTK